MYSNASIKVHYEKGHIYTSREIEEDTVFDSVNWKNPVKQRGMILEIGCGEGSLSQRIYNAGGVVMACDYVDYGWETIAGKTPMYFKNAYDEMNGIFDVVVMQGVLEHMDDPKKVLKTIKDRYKPDIIISSSPCWMNPRGIVLQTLYNLFDLPITLADLHYLTPDDMELEGYNLTWKDIDHDWASGQKMINDLANRLPKVLDNVEANVEKLMHWLKKVPPQGLGATIIYKLEKL